uniref:Lipoprotein n=2 Tax=Cupriavidus TaxID=106589 RepID=Q46V61_CUPPJ
MPASCFVPLVRRARRAAIVRKAPAAAAAFAMALTGACASIESSTMRDLLDSWKGIPIDDAKAQWGPPQAVQAVPGGTAYVWQDIVPQPAKPPTTEAHDAGVEAPRPPGRCERRLVAGPDDAVMWGEWSGDACCVTTLVGYCAGLKHRTRQ